MLQHVAIELDPYDVPRARLFWQIIGFVEVEPPLSLQGGTVWLEAPALSGAGRVQIHLILVESPANPGTGHPALVIPELDKVVAALRADGFEVLERTPHWGTERVFAIHPGGTRVELMASPPPSGLHS